MRMSMRHVRRFSVKEYLELHGDYTIMQEYGGLTSASYRQLTFLLDTVTPFQSAQADGSGARRRARLPGSEPARSQGIR